MIDKFEVGKWYVFDATEYKKGGIPWNPDGGMDFLKDGRPHQCTFVSGGRYACANFDGHTDGWHSDGTWSFHGYLSYISEVESPEEAEFKRGDVVLVADDADEPYSNWHERIFLARIEGAKSPYVVVHAGYEDDFRSGKPFCTITYRYAEPRTEVNTAVKALETAVEEAEEAFGYAREELEDAEVMHDTATKKYNKAIDTLRLAQEALKKYKKEKNV